MSGFKKHLIALNWWVVIIIIILTVGFNKLRDVKKNYTELHKQHNHVSREVKILNDQVAKILKTLYAIVN